MYNETEKTIVLSSLGKTWILDLDGTIVKHNGYKIDGEDTLLDGAISFFKQIAAEDKVIFLTSRSIELKEKTETFLLSQGIRYDAILYEMPFGERILVNDKKPSGLHTAIAVNTERDVFMDVMFERNEVLWGENTDECISFGK